MDTCLSGGAIGADEEWGLAWFYFNNKKKAPIHFSFKGHNPKHTHWAHVLSEKQLKAADPFVKKANKTLGRTFPTKSETVNNLLRRNYYQIQKAERIYAVSNIDWDKNEVEGGTSWAIQMFIDRSINERFNPEIYVFDQKTNAWYSWTASGWLSISKPPVPHGIWAGIGSRKLTPEGKHAIKNIFIP